MPRKTAIQKLREELGAQIETTRNANSSLAFVRGEREKAREERDASDRKVLSAMAMIQSQQKHHRILFQSLYSLNIALARSQGYIDRVRELDKAVVEPVVEPDVGSIIDRERMNLAGAKTDHQVDRVLDAMDTEILDQVLGRGAVGDAGFNG